MKNIARLIFLLLIGIVSTLQAETTFLEGARETVTLHPSCRNENTGLTAMSVALPVGPEIKVTIANSDGEDTSSTMTLPYPDALISVDRKGKVFNANPVMGASPSFNQSAIFGMDTVKASVAMYGSEDKTEDVKTVYWKLKEVNVYDVDSNTMMTLPYLPDGELITVELGVALPKFTPTSCLMTLQARGAQIARCDQIDPVTKAVLANSEPDIRKKRMRLTIERDLENNPLPARCGEGLSVTVEPTDAEAEELENKMKALAS